jgi:hypothetical protein
MISAGLALAACSASHNTSSQHRTSLPQAAPSGANPCAPAICGANVSGPTTTTTAAKTSRPPATKALAAWGAAHLGDLQTLSSEASHLLAGAGSVDQEKTLCNQLSASTQAAQSAPPPPDAATAARLQTALTQLAQLAHDCTAAFGGSDPAAASRLVYEANQGTAAINDVIHSVNGSGNARS